MYDCVLSTLLYINQIYLENCITVNPIIKTLAVLQILKIFGEGFVGGRHPKKGNVYKIFNSEGILKITFSVLQGYMKVSATVEANERKKVLHHFK